TLACVSKTSSMPTGADDLKTFGTNVANIFATVCSKIDCGPISTNATTGVYGKYSFCDTLQRVNWAMTAYYANFMYADYACDFKGFAKMVKPASNSDANCSSQKDDTSSSSSGSSSDKSDSSGSSSSDKTSKKSAAASSSLSAISAGAAAIAALAAAFF
ncbi:40S ribosomal protein S27, partial [Dipsacomyces acuminosporus]